MAIHSCLYHDIDCIALCNNVTEFAEGECIGEVDTCADKYKVTPRHN